MPITIQDDMVEAALLLPEDQGKRFIAGLVLYGSVGIEPSESEPWFPMFVLCKDRIEMSTKAHEKGKRMAQARYGKKEQVDEPTADNTQASCTDENKHNAQATTSRMLGDTQASCTDSNKQHPKKEIEKEIENKKKEIKRKKKSAPPTVEEVAAYVAEHNYAYVDPETFVSYYASQGWKKANGQPLSDWKIACSGWNSRARNRGEPEVRSTASRAPMPDKYAAFSGEVTS